MFSSPRIHDNNGVVIYSSQFVCLSLSLKLFIFWNWDFGTMVRNDLVQGSPAPGPRTSVGPWPVRNQAAQQEVSGRRLKLHLPLPIAHITASTIPPHPPPPAPRPGLWKNCLPRNWSLVPERLGSAALVDPTHHPDPDPRAFFRVQAQWMTGGTGLESKLRGICVCFRGR